jgi:hypothetical protein
VFAGPISIEDTAPQGHVEAVATAFGEAGFEVEVVADYGRRSAGVLPWIVRITLDETIKGFFIALGAAGFKTLYGAIKRARDGANSDGEGTIELYDPESSWMILPASLPDEAIDALGTLDWDRLRGGYLVWKSAEKEWVNATPRKE